MTKATDIDDDTLQRFYDGDLSPLEEHGVMARIESDPSAQRRLAELGEITELLRVGTEELGYRVDSVALYAAIEAQLAQPDETTFTTRFRLITSEWVEHRRAALVPIIAASAVAAVTLFAVVKPGDPSLQGPDLQGADNAPLVAQQEPAAPAVAAIPAVHGSQVEDVDFGSSTGTVFEIDNQGVAVAVVWITDEDLP